MFNLFEAHNLLTHPRFLIQRKKQKPRDSSNATASNPAEAAKAMLSKKRFSKKINYAAIDSLFGPTKRSGSTVDGEDDEEDDASEAGDEPPPRAGADFLADMEHMSNRGRSATPAELLFISLDLLSDQAVEPVPLENDP